MSTVRIACQAITWGQDIGKRLSEILPAISDAGYEGVEIGFRHIQALNAEEVRDLVSRHGLRLVASHLGGNLEDPGQARGERGMIDQVVDYLQVTGTTLLMYSGLRFESEDQIARDIEMINRAAGRCAEAGIRLLYHNHNWEFADRAKVMKRLLSEASPELGLCPDVGWVAKAGVEVIDWLTTVKPRIGAIHFKDFASFDEGVDTVELGEGVVPLSDVSDWIRANFEDLWVIAEQDRAAIPAAEAAKKNAVFMKRALG